MGKSVEIRSDLGDCSVCGNERFEFKQEIDSVAGGGSLKLYTCTSCGNGKTVDSAMEPFI